MTDNQKNQDGKKSDNLDPTQDKNRDARTPRETGDKRKDVDQPDQVIKPSQTTR